MNTIFTSLLIIFYIFSTQICLAAKAVKTKSESAILVSAVAPVKEVVGKSLLNDKFPAPSVFKNKGFDFF